MSQSVEVEVQGLTVEIIVPPGIKNYRKTSVGIEFPCECGINKLSVGYVNFPMKDWERLLEARRQADAWRKATEKASDFVGYILKTEEARKKFEERFGSLWEGGVLTQAMVTCHVCRRTYGFQIGVSNPLRVDERLNPWGVYQRYGLKNTKDFKKTVAEWIHFYGDRHEPVIKTAADYLEYLGKLEAALKDVDRVAETLRKTIEKMRAANSNVVLESWLEDLEASIDGVAQDFKANCEKKLKRYVEELANLVTEPTPLGVVEA